ncbi:hypothetical protein FDH86_gp104 [Arthrobacter phage Tank]|uniref:Uncharacterized protein n=1 Tax=Arthrobacter phage Tank TaxID=1772319 RepID=A0A0U4IQA0_9CAUD|nr:hypothetical protein FDH86_gp104 [Arthrobacter phage Tank]ALY10639.1 hypothetical protein TANK_104 [Arthrobacter phage Tank]
MERRSPHRIVRGSTFTDQRLAPYRASVALTTDLIPGYWRLVVVQDGKARVRQYPHAQNHRALAHFGWFVIARASAPDFYVSLENASGQCVDEFERRMGETFRPAAGAHQIVEASIPGAHVGEL